MTDAAKEPSWGHCPRCGTQLPPGATPGLCPKCLLQAGMASSPPPDSADLNDAAAPDGLRSTLRGLPQPGECLGQFRIVRPLGAGGMGAVFEAEDLESGRRVALKVLSHALDSPESRERFFREGRLAAALNHPNSVYIFGTGEVAGTPVIAMELVPGGTLQDRLRQRGPLPVSEAVDAILQVIAGLEAARRAGILHRDVKPSNCFLDADGTVKIGDFGLSISTAIRVEPALTATGQFLGTPAFCSPEQLRGEELSARSDLYSVGATLFYLLTGRTPFEADNVVRLLATVLEQRAPSPRRFRPEIPSGLARMVLRCLEKQPSDRYKSYESLRQALAPYASGAPTPATLGLRFLAGALDQVILGIAFFVAAAPFGDPLEIAGGAAQSPRAFAWVIAGLGAALLYYAISEGFWGATLGKAICRLRVVGPDNSAPGVPRAFVRGLFYVVLPALPFWALNRGDPYFFLRGSTALQYLAQFSFYIILALLFCTVRRRNGFAALHDLATRTRVVSRRAFQTRPALATIESPPPAIETRPRIGPYHVLESISGATGVEWVVAYDLRLLRKVWVRQVPAGTAPLSPMRRGLGRIGRLRWLAGRRSAEENWDAFEAVSGQSLLALAQSRRSWGEVRYWLYDLAAEISAASKDGTLPAEFGLDRVWITSDGRAKLLDFPAPGVESVSFQGAARGAASGGDGGPQGFLRVVATAALTGAAHPDADASVQAELSVPLALHARAFLNGFAQVRDADAAKAALKPLLQRVAVVTRARRLAVVAGCAALPLIFAVMFFFGGLMLKKWDRQYPGLMQLNTLLHQHSAMRRFGGSRPEPAEDAYAVYIAVHYRSLITNDAAWSSPVALAMIKGDARRFAEQSVREYPAPTAQQATRAEEALKPIVRSMQMPDFSRAWGILLIAVPAMLAIYVVIPALLAALLFRGGLILRMAGITFARGDGMTASRLRVFWRALVAWSPVFIVLILSLPVARGHPVLAAALAYAAVCGLAIVSASLPERGLPDRLAATWPVPR